MGRVEARPTYGLGVDINPDARVTGANAYEERILHQSLKDGNPGHAHYTELLKGYERAHDEFMALGDLQNAMFLEPSISGRANSNGALSSTALARPSPPDYSRNSATSTWFSGRWSSVSEEPTTIDFPTTMFSDQMDSSGIWRRGERWPCNFLSETAPRGTPSS